MDLAAEREEKVSVVSYVKWRTFFRNVNELAPLRRIAFFLNTSADSERLVGSIQPHILGLQARDIAVHFLFRVAGRNGVWFDAVDATTRTAVGQCSRMPCTYLASHYTTLIFRLSDAEASNSWKPFYIVEPVDNTRAVKIQFLQKYCLTAGAGLTSLSFPPTDGPVLVFHVQSSSSHSDVHGEIVQDISTQ